MLLDIAVGIIKLNNNLDIEIINKYLISFIGNDLDVFYLGVNIDTFFKNLIHPEDNISIDSDASTSETQTARILCKDKQYNWFRISKNTITCEKDNKSREIIITLQDINDQKVLEQQLLKDQKRLEEAYKHKSSFLANISHEVRTPINGIVGMITLLEDTALTDEQSSYLEMVKECSFNLMAIINDILDYSKLEAGKLVIDVKCMSLAQCIESTNDIILSKMYEKNIEYTYNIESDLPEYIRGDSNRIKQVILNLLSNAVKFTDRGNINLDVKRIHRNEFTGQVQPGNDLFLKFSITDSGCGIADEDTKKLFQSFSQINNAVSTKLHGGTGLGLAISKELITLMNGSIFLERSEVDRGSTFSFIIQTSSCSNENDKFKNNILQNANILIVDDNLQNRMSLTAMVTKWGMRAHIFSNSQEALFYTKFQKFDIGLIDICMPKMDGKMLAEKLAMQLKDEMFPLVALTSLGDKMQNSKYFHSVLLKPVKESKLRDLCTELLINRSKNLELESAEVKNSESLASTNLLAEIIPNVRFLIAEDVYINQCVIMNFLKKLGYHNFDVVSNGIECLKQLELKEYDVILLDIRMPGLNGDEVAKEIINYYNKPIPIPSNKYAFKNVNKPVLIAITAYCLKDDKEKYLSMGFDEYISKPIDINTLKNCLEHVVESIMLQ